jgi:hypothetical protein
MSWARFCSILPLSAAERLLAVESMASAAARIFCVARFGAVHYGAQLVTHPRGRSHGRCRCVRAAPAGIGGNVMTSDGVGDKIELGGKARHVAAFAAAVVASAPRRRSRERGAQCVQLAHDLIMAEAALRCLDAVLEPHGGGLFDAEDLARLGHTSLDQRMSDQFPDPDYALRLNVAFIALVRLLSAGGLYR